MFLAEEALGAEAACLAGPAAPLVAPITMGAAGVHYAYKRHQRAKSKY